MRNAESDLPEGNIRFSTNYEPGLKDAVYQLTLSQTISAPDATVPDHTQIFTVAGPRFTLDSAEVHAQFPPPGASSQFADVLPHVVLNKRLLPWERDIPGLAPEVPWLALLVFAEGELLASDPGLVIANYARTMTVADLLAQPGRVPTLTVSADDKTMKCQVITVSSATFAAVVPTALELPFLAHAREVDTSGKVLLDMKDEGLFSVVVANRFPAPGDDAGAARSIVHLVSLEGFGDLLGGTVPVKPAGDQVQLISLASWSFACLPDLSQRFSGLAKNLAFDTTGAPRPAGSLMLQLPLPPPSGAEGDAVTTARMRLSAGYVAAGYHAPTGEESFAWYRGPLTPVVASPVPKSGPFGTSSAATIYDSVTGVLDHSLAAAWQCGRALALADQTFATTLLRLRKKASAQLDQIAAQGSRRPSQHSDAHTRLAKLIAGGVVGALGQISKSGDLVPAARAPVMATRPPPVQALRALVARADVCSALRAGLADDPDAVAVADWLGRLQLLVGVPFVHLVPDARMLPRESIRFFFLDPDWIGAVTDGAMHVGLGSTREGAIQLALTEQLEAMAASAALASRATSLGLPVPPARADPSSGLLIRSALVAGWPGLTVTGTAAGGAVVPLLRMERLASDVLFCLFNGVPQTVTLTEPHEGLEFGVDDGVVATRTLSGAVVTEGVNVPVYDPQQPAVGGTTIRAGGLRVLNLNINPTYATAGIPPNPADLLSALACALELGTSLLHSALFALQMVKGPQVLTFSLGSLTQLSTRSLRP